MTLDKTEPQLPRAAKIPAEFSRSPWLDRVLLLIVTLTGVLAASLWRRVLGGDTLSYASCSQAFYRTIVLEQGNNYYLYPFLIHLSERVLGPTLLALHAAPWLCAALTPLLLALLILGATRSSLAALIGGLFYCAFPFQLYSVNVPLTEPIFIFGLLLCMFVMQMYSVSAGKFALLGTLCGLLILCRYDSVLAGAFFLASIVWEAQRANTGWKRLIFWIILCIIAGSSVLSPLLYSNRMRNRCRVAPPVTSLTPDEKRALSAALPAWLDTHAWKISDGELGVSSPQLNAWYAQKVPRSNRPTLPLALRQLRPVSATGQQPAGPPTIGTFLPQQKISGWGAVLRQHFRGGLRDWMRWLNEAKARADLSLKLWAIVLTAIIGVLVGSAVCMETIGAIRRRDPVHLPILLFTTAYTILALFFIRGNAMRHVARIVPLYCFYSTRTWVRIRSTTSRMRGTLSVSTFLLIVAAAAVTLNYTHSRRDVAWASMVDLIRQPIPYSTLHDVKTTFVRNRVLRKLLHEDHVPSPATTTDVAEQRRVVFNFTDTNVPPHSTIRHIPEEVLLSNGKGVFGIHEGQPKTTVDIRVEVPVPIQRVSFNTWVYVGNPYKVRGDWIEVQLSTDGGSSWTNVPLQLYAQRATPVHLAVSPTSKSNREVCIRFHFQTWPAERLRYDSGFISLYTPRATSQRGGCALLLDSLTLTIDPVLAQHPAQIEEEN